VLWLLLLLSGLSLAVAVEKAIFFIRSRVPVIRIGAEFQSILYGEGVEAAKKLLARHAAGPQVRIVLAGLEEAGGGARAAQNAMAARGAIEKLRMERNLNFLATLGNNAPFIGLFGTVLGIIRSFHDLSLNMSGGASVVMAGISEALVATAVGLFVAIPAVIFNNVFQRKARKALVDTTILEAVLLTWIETRAGGPGKGDAR
jgi:biopolymer transport protein ExbB